MNSSVTTLSPTGRAAYGETRPPDLPLAGGHPDLEVAPGRSSRGPESAASALAAQTSALATLDSDWREMRSATHPACRTISAAPGCSRVNRTAAQAITLPSQRWPRAPVLAAVTASQECWPGTTVARWWNRSG